MSDVFADRLLASIGAKRAPICVGIDPIFEMFPDAIAGSGAARNANDSQAVVDAIAEACANLFLNLASQRIVIGGGVINQRPWIVEAVQASAARKLGGYLPFVRDRAAVVAAELGADAGPTGALLLAERALVE